MSRELLVLDARAVFKVKPSGDERKVSVAPSFRAEFRTAAECQKKIMAWAIGQYKSAAGLHVHVMKPEVWHPFWRADVLRGDAVLAHIEMTPPRRTAAPDQEGLFP